MNKRIQKLRTQSREAIPYLSLERALLITEFFKKDDANKFSTPIVRAKAFKYILEIEAYKNLIVRVAGYSDYFNNLGSDLQDEIISRTEHTLI